MGIESKGILGREGGGGNRTKSITDYLIKN